MMWLIFRTGWKSAIVHLIRFWPSADRTNWSRRLIPFFRTAPFQTEKSIQYYMSPAAAQISEYVTVKRQKIISLLKYFVSKQNGNKNVNDLFRQLHSMWIKAILFLHTAFFSPSEFDVRYCCFCFASFFALFLLICTQHLQTFISFVRLTTKFNMCQ